MTRERRSRLVDLELNRAETLGTDLRLVRRTLDAILSIPVEDEATDENDDSREAARGAN